MTTIYDALTAKLGRKPTHQETKDEVRRILRDAKIDARDPVVHRMSRRMEVRSQT